MWPGRPGAVKPEPGFFGPKSGVSRGCTVASGAWALPDDDAVQRVVAHGDERAVAERPGQGPEGRDAPHSREHVAVELLDAARPHQAHALHAPVGEQRQFEDDVPALALFDRPIGKRAR